MFISWLTCIPAVLLPHSPCRRATANAPANRQMPIASVVRCNLTQSQTIIDMITITNNKDLKEYIENLPPVKDGFARLYRGQNKDFGSLKPSAIFRGKQSNYELFETSLEKMVES